LLQLAASMRNPVRSRLGAGFLFNRHFCIMRACNS
jgi:hypothetical protein